MAKAKTTTKRAKKDPAAKPKHVTIEVGQRLLVHVVKNGKPVSEYISGADPDGVVSVYAAPEAAAPVQDPNPQSDGIVKA